MIRRRRGEWRAVVQGTLEERAGAGFGRTIGAALRALASDLDGDGSRVARWTPSWAEMFAASTVEAALAARAEAVLGRYPPRPWTLYLPFPETLISAGETREIVTEALGYRCKPTRLLIPCDIAEFLWVNDIRMGCVSQYRIANHDPNRTDGQWGVPARAFTEVALGIGYDFDAVEPGQTIRLLVHNAGPNDVTFRATMMVEDRAA